MKLFTKKYKVDYCGKKFAYLDAKDSYRAGEKVTLYFHMIATDTDYTFTLDGRSIQVGYDNSKGFIIEFIMPDHDVVLRCDSRNTMTIDYR